MVNLRGCVCELAWAESGKRENTRLGEVADVAQRFESAMDLRGGSRLAVGTERQGGMKCTHGDHRKGQVERLEEEQNSEREMGHKFL